MHRILVALGVITLSFPSSPLDAQVAGVAPMESRKESAQQESAPPESGDRIAGATQQATPTLLLGIFLERNYSTQPGIQASLEGGRFGGRWPRLEIGYSTTRMAISRGANALKEDRVRGGAAWHFRPDAVLGPFAGLHFGYTRFDREDENLFALLDNGSPIASLLLGLEVRVPSGTRMSGSVGYSALHSSTVYPFVASIGIHREIRGWTR